MSKNIRPYNILDKDIDLKDAELVLSIFMLCNNKQHIEDGTYYKFQRSAINSEFLNAIYKIDDYPSKEVRKDISIIIAATVRHVQVWFQNKRQKFKVMSIKDQKEYLNSGKKYLKSLVTSERVKYDEIKDKIENLDNQIVILDQVLNNEGKRPRGRGNRRDKRSGNSRNSEMSEFLNERILLIIYDKEYEKVKRRELAVVGKDD